MTTSTPPDLPEARPLPATDEAFGSVEHELAVLFRRARAMSKDFAREVHPDLEPDAYGLLLRLFELGQMRATDLSTYFGVGKPTISRQVRLLEDLGLVRREPDPSDGRASVLALTPDGRRRIAAAKVARQEIFHRLLSTWEPADVAELGRLLARFNGAVHTLGS
jgi:DNA-binding MarR family transcriptional regulator